MNDHDDAPIFSKRMQFRADLLLEPGPDGAERRLGDVWDAWQQEDFEALDSPEVRHVYWERPRGHDKTGGAATEALVEMFVDHTPDRRLYAAACDIDQADILYEDVLAKLRRRPDLMLQVAIDRARHRMTVKTTGTRLEVISSDAPSAYGLRPDWIVLDELAQWRGRELWDSLWSSMAKRPASRMLVITSAGWDREGLCWEVRQIAEHEANWRLSSRGQCASWITPEDLAQQKRTLPDHVFRRLHLSEWIEGTGAFLTVLEVDGVFTDTLPTGLTYQTIGLDLGLSGDRSVLALLGRAPDGRVVVESLQTWSGTREAKVNLMEVEEATAALAVRTGAPVWFDNWQAEGMAQRLRQRDVKMWDYVFSQSKRQALFAALLDVIRRGALVSAPHAALRKELLGLDVQQTAGGWRADHPRGQHDDHVVAVALAARWILERTARDGMRERGTSVDRMQEHHDAQIEAWIVSVKARLVAAGKDAAHVAAMERHFAQDRDMLRRHLLAYLESGSLKERLDRGFGRTADAEADWDARPD